MPPSTRQVSKIQAKLDFSPVPKDSLQAQQLAPSVRDRASAVRFYSPKTAKAVREISTSTPRSTNNTKSKLRSNTRAGQQQLQLSHRSSRVNGILPRIDGPSSTDDRIYGSQRKSSPSRRPYSDSGSSKLVNGGRGNVAGEVPASSPPVERGEDEDDDEDEAQLVLPVSMRSRPQIVDDDDDDDEDDLGIVLQKQNTEAVPNTEGNPELPDRIVRNQASARETIDVDGSDTDTSSEDELVLPSSTRSLRRPNMLTLESDDEDAPISSSARVSKRLHSRSDQVQSSSSPTKKRRLQQGPKPRRMTREEQDEEVLEDAQDLQDTATLDQGLRSTSKINEKKLARQKQLSKLAARRNKTATTTIEISSSEPEEDLAPYRPYNDTYSDDNSSQADSLIDDGDLDAPSPTSSTEEIRINRSVYDIPSALYYIIQQLLHTKFFPSTHDTDNSYYIAAHSLISKRLESYANQYISSIWRKDFTAALHARPKLTWPRNELTMWDFCEACGRRDHPARFVMRFEGPCYNEQTLESINNDENSTVFQRFDTQVSEDTVWHVGADCHDNAWRAHRAVHWRFGLSIQIDKALVMMGVNIEERSEQPKRQSDESRPRKRDSQSKNYHNTLLDDDDDDDEEDEQEDEQALEQEDRFQATLLQMEDQGYMQALQNEFLERFEMVDDEDDDDD